MKEIILFEEKLMTPSTQVQKEAYKMLVESKELKAAIYEKYAPIIKHAVNKNSAKSLYDCLKSLIDQLFIPKPNEDWDILDLSKMKGDKLTSLSDEFFEFPLIQNIWQLDASNHEINSISKNIEKLKKLKRVVIANNQLKELPENILKLESLEELVLANNQLNSLSEEIAQCTKLEYLNLRYNEFTEIPNVVYKIPSLTGLNLSGNRKVEYASEIIAQLKNLRELDISNCAIKKLPDSFWEKQSLMYLNFANSSIEEIPDAIFNLPQLKSLDLTGAVLSDERKYDLAVKLGDIVKGVNPKKEPFLSMKAKKASVGKSPLDNEAYLFELKMINGTTKEKNEVKKMVKESKELAEKLRARYDFILKQLPKNVTDKRLPIVLGQILSGVELDETESYWKTLDLSGVKETITQLDESFFEDECIAKLETLKLDDHRIQQVSEKIAECKNLKSLSLYGNKLEQLPKGLEHATSLKYLNLHENLLDDLPKELLNLTNIEEINIGGNKKMTTFPAVILEMKQLKKIELAFNEEIKALPTAINKLENLEYLSCYMSGVADIPDELWELKRLRYVDLEESEVENLSNEVKKCTSLERLVLTQTPIPEARKKALENLLSCKVYY